MSVIEKLDSVVKLCDAACAMVPSPEGVAAIKQAETAAADFVIENHDAIRQDMSDARRLRAYRDATFDGNAVYAALDDRAKSRTSADNVADVLDALNRVARLASDSEGGE